MSFVTNLDDSPPVLPTDGPEPESAIPVDWFGEIDPVWVRKAYRIAATVTPDRLREALIAGIITVGRDLAGWKSGKVALGCASLADVPSDQIDGASELVTLYRRAVATAAKAELVERFRDMDITGTGERKAEDLDPTIGELRRDSLYAIRDMKGCSRTTVELI